MTGHTCVETRITVAIHRWATGSVFRTLDPSARPVRAPEPDPRDDTDEPDDDPAVAPSDPETEAMRLLQERLGARPVD